MKYITKTGLGFIILFMIPSILFWTGFFEEKGTMLNSIPQEFKGAFVETTQSTVFGSKDPIRIQVSDSKVVINDPDGDSPKEFSITKILRYNDYIDLYYPNGILFSCIRVYFIKGLFYFYQAAPEEEYEGRKEDKIGEGFYKSL